jgi:hypothetical protein
MFKVTLSVGGRFVYRTAETRREAFEIASLLLDQASPEFVSVTIVEDGFDDPVKVEKRRRAIGELMRARREGR